MRNLIDHWLVVDTGSTDGTQDLVETILRELPGRLVERPWVDFGHNRSEALALARALGTYTLIIDADDELLLPAIFTLPHLDADSYVLDIVDNGVSYQRPQLVSNALPWRYDGILHEFLTCEAARTVGHLPVVMRRNHDGRRRRDPSTYANDAAILKTALETTTDAFLVSRYTFYLAQSYRDSGNREGAIAAYLRRATLGFWDQEIFVSLYEAARQMEALGQETDAVLATYQRAVDACQARAEADHGASRLCRFKGRHEQGYAIAKRALAIKPPNGGLFVERWIYDYGLLDEFAVHAFWTGHYGECRAACQTLLARDDLPVAERQRVVANARFADERLAARASSLSNWQPARPCGGTEIMVDGLRTRMGAELEAINLCVNAYDEATLDARPLVVWIHHDINQQPVQWLTEAGKAARVDRFVFVSEWQRARYIKHFRLDVARCIVLRNATETTGANRIWTSGRPLKMAYTSAPYRGLSVLLDAWERLAPGDAELHIWSSHKLYGPDADDKPYARLYERARALPNAFYHGILPHDELRDVLQTCDFLTYPATFEETSCLAAIDALAAGCRVICPSYGALPETVGRFARVYPFIADEGQHAAAFARLLSDEIRDPWNGEAALCEEQQTFARDTYDWAVRVREWKTFIASMVGEDRLSSSVWLEQKGLPYEALLRLRNRGFAPSGIIDAGAFDGQFSRLARNIFPSAHILMIDALAEKAPVLAAVCHELGNAVNVIALLGQEPLDTASFFVANTDARPDLVKTGSSVFKENSSFPMDERQIPQTTLDAIVTASGQSFSLIKLDVQGAELEVLRGLGEHLAAAEVILIEMSLVEYNNGAPLMDEVLGALRSMGFVLYDIVEEHRYRDRNLLQIDGIFLRHDSRFWPQKPFWT